jgi:hypothetical protein
MPATKTAEGQNGRLCLQPAPTKTKGTSFHFSNLLIADDGAFLFESFATLLRVPLTCTKLLLALVFSHTPVQLMPMFP